MNDMRRALVLAPLVVFLLAGPAKAQSDPGNSAAGCVGSDANNAKPEVREAACLLELKERASRVGKVLTLRLDNGTTKTFRSDPEARKNDLAKKCIDYRLVGFHPAAGRYLLYVAGYETSECRLVSARRGKATTFGGIPDFAPDGSTFFFTGNDDTGVSWMGIGSVASDPPVLLWQMGDNEDWEFARWISNE
jgi:hypothetical protein